MSLVKAINKLYHKTHRNEIQWEIEDFWYVTSFKKWKLMIYKDKLKINYYTVQLPEVKEVYDLIIGEPSIVETPDWVHEFLADIINT